MNEVLSALLASMHADVARMDRIGMNIANAGTTGYKRETGATFANRLADAAPPAGGSALAASAHLDLRPGTLRTTGQPLDLALSGAGWFEIATEQGPAYTRRGDFRLDTRGRIVTQQGLPLQGVGGDIQLAHGRPVIDAAGQVFESAAAMGERAQPIARVKVVQFDAGTAMQRTSDGLMLARGDASPVADASIQLQQGFLENANVSHMHEMVRLLETLRHMESLQKVALGYDEMLGGAIRKLGDAA